MNLPNIAIVGSGRLAEALSCAVIQNGMSLTIIARNNRRALEIAERCRQLAHEGQNIHTTTIEHSPSDGDIYIIAVSDRAIGEVAQALPIAAGSIVVHTSGATPIEAIPARFRRGVLYPLQTFTAEGKVDFSQIPIFIEGCDAECEALLREFASSLSRSVAHADSEQRRRLHLAAVFACNFANHMFAIGCDIVHDAGFDFETLLPLIHQTVENAAGAKSPRDIQTGPAVRGDIVSQQRHLDLISYNDRLSEIYKLISENIWETSKKI